MKELYRNLCQECNDIPLFQQAWWLDAAAGDDWDVVLVEKGGRIEAALPYILEKAYGLTIISQPKLTQFLGPWISPSDAKKAKRIGREKDLMQGLIDKLPPHQMYRQNWAPSCQNWMPFFWNGFTQTTRYTYQLQSLTNLDDVWGGFQENIRREVRKARKLGVTVSQTEDVDAFRKMNEMVFKRQNKTALYNEEYVKRIDQAARQRGQRAIFTAKDDSGKEHAAVYLVWDDNSAYYLMGGGDPALRSSGATSLCMWEAIQFASTVTQCFDFEGSMLEPVERFFRAFGGEPVPFFSVSRSHTGAAKLLDALRLLRR